MEALSPIAAPDKSSIYSRLGLVGAYWPFYRIRMFIIRTRRLDWGLLAIFAQLLA
jgi:hypothetical protein